MADEQNLTASEPSDSSLQTPAPESPKKKRIKEALARVPSVSEGEWRIACSDIAEELSKHTGFRFKVMVPIAVALIAILGAMIGYFGISTKKDIEEELQVAKSDATKRIGEARDAIAAQIATEFREEKVQTTVEKAAADQSALLLSKSVQPSIELFNQRMETRLAAFDEFLKSQQKQATADLESLRKQLEILTARNKLVALGDAAVANGEVKAYRTLEEMSKKASPLELDTQAIATAELIRVYSAYSFGAPTRIQSFTIDASVINPSKTKEDELDGYEIAGVLKREVNPIGRARLAFLLSKKGNAGSFKTAELIAEAMRAEVHLEALRYMQGAFKHVTNFDKGGKLDGSTALAWWDAHKEELRANDTDKPTESPK